MPTSATRTRQRPPRVGNVPHARLFLGISAILLLITVPGITPLGDTAQGRLQPGTPTASPAASPAATPAAVAQDRVRFITGEVTIEITDDAMRPSNLESAVGHTLTITVVNASTAPHGFVIDELEVDLELQPGESETVEIGAPDLGDYRFYSDLPGDEHLEGRLTIFI